MALAFFSMKVYKNSLLYVHCKDIFFNCYLVVPQPTLGHSQENSFTNPMLVTAFELFRSECHWEPRNEVGSLNLAERLVGFESGTFRF